MAVLLQRGDFLRCRKLCSTFVIPVSHLHQGGCSAILAVNYDVGVKRYFAPSDTELLRALHSRNSKNIRNPLIFLQKMASYSCFWRVPSSKILLQASLQRIYDLLTLVSSYIRPTHYLLLRVQFLCFKLLPCVNRWHLPKKPASVPKHQYRSQN